MEIIASKNVLTDIDFKIQEPAQEYISSLLEKEKDRGDIFLRLIVDTGGCAGMKYHFMIDDYYSEDDFFVNAGEKNLLAIDNYSFEYVKNSTMRLHDDFENTELKIDNPNVTNSCSCGSSFGCEKEDEGKVVDKKGNCDS